MQSIISLWLPPCEAGGPTPAKEVSAARGANPPRLRFAPAVPPSKGGTT